MGRVYEALRRAAEKKDAQGNGSDGVATENNHASRRTAHNVDSNDGSGAGDDPLEQVLNNSSVFRAAPGEQSRVWQGSASNERIEASGVEPALLDDASASRVAGATLDAVGSARAVGEVPVLEISPARVEPHLVSITQPQSPYCEQFRSLRTHVLHAGERRKMQTFVITSASIMEGKTVTAINLAWLLAQADGVRALLIDCDLRHPCSAEYLDVNMQVGLSEVLTDRATLEESIIRLEPAGLYLLPGGAPHDKVADLLMGPKFGAILQDVRKMFDYIIIDAPPLGIFTDATMLINRADAAIIVVRSGRTRYATLDRIVSTLPQERLLGVVLNGADEKLDESSYYYQRRYAGRNSSSNGNGGGGDDADAAQTNKETETVRDAEQEEVGVA